MEPNEKPGFRIRVLFDGTLPRVRIYFPVLRFLLEPFGLMKGVPSHPFSFTFSIAHVAMRAF